MAKDNRDGAPPHYSQPYDEGLGQGVGPFHYPIVNDEWVTKKLSAPSHDGVADYEGERKKKKDSWMNKEIMKLLVLFAVLYIFKSLFVLGLAFGFWFYFMARPAWFKVRVWRADIAELPHADGGNDEERLRSVSS